MSIGIYKASILKPEFNQKHFRQFYSENDALIIDIVEELKPNEFNSRYIGLIKRVEKDKTTGKVILKILSNSEELDIKVGDKIATNQAIKEISGPKNPGEFDFKSWAKKKGLYDQIIAKPNQVIIVDRNNQSFQNKALRLRESILDSLRKHNFSKENFSVFSALLLGHRHELADDLVDQYRAAGAMHLLAISGLHIGIFLFVLNLLLKFMNQFKRGALIRMIILLACLWSYAFLTGMSVSVLRSVLMFSVLCIGLVSKKKSQLGQYLIISMFVSLFINPLFLFDVGFQMSYTAVFSILWISPLFERIWKPKLKLTKYFWGLIAVSISAQIGVAPLSLFYFNQVSMLFLASSLVLIPILALALGSGILLIALDRFDILATSIARGYESIIMLMNSIIKDLSRFDILVIDQVYYTIPLMIGCYLGLFYTIKLLESGRVQFFKKVLICVIFIQIQIMYKKWQTECSEELVVFHNPRTTLFGIRKGSTFQINALPENHQKQVKQRLFDYQAQHMNIKLKFQNSKKHFYRVKSAKVLLLDSQFAYVNDGFKADIVILSHSPKFNLDRFLNDNHPKLIIADGSNYHSFINRWEESCNDAGVGFYNTALKGSFIGP